MKTAIVFLVAITFCWAGSAYAIYAVYDRGVWPNSWPKELESLRKRARTIRGGQLDLMTYHIPFTKREDFEAAWPHLLKVKSKGAPIILVRSPLSHWHFGTLKAGVHVHTPSPNSAERAEPEPTAGGRALLSDHWWFRTSYIVLVVDGEIVNLNRIPLPAETAIIDERFKDAPNQAPSP
jgi:hypothetical protein